MHVHHAQHRVCQMEFIYRPGSWQWSDVPRRVTVSHGRPDRRNAGFQVPFCLSLDATDTTHAPTLAGTRSPILPDSPLYDSPIREFHVMDSLRRFGTWSDALEPLGWSSSKIHTIDGLLAEWQCHRKTCRMP